MFGVLFYRIVHRIYHESIVEGCMMEKEEKLDLGEQMADNSIFKDISNRTGGNIYISAVGPVRTGKSTFIKKFMDLVVLPRITDEYDRARTTDSLPQSGAGKTIMTTELKN